jgi:hypothetical protein
LENIIRCSALQGANFFSVPLYRNDGTKFRRNTAVLFVRTIGFIKYKEITNSHYFFFVTTGAPVPTFFAAGTGVFGV